MRLPFSNRVEAGRLLAAELKQYRDRPGVIVIGLPRGGVSTAFEVARALRAPLDVMPVRKLGTPGQKELAMGAIAPGGVRVLDEGLIRELGVPQEAIDQMCSWISPTRIRRWEWGRDKTKSSSGSRTLHTLP